MRLNPTLLALLTAALLAPMVATAAERLPPECRRFSSEKARPNDFAPRLARLCVLLIDANASSGGLSPDEKEAATRLGTYLAIVGELDLRKGAVGIGNIVRGAKPTTETSRYLIADRIGLLDIADRLAPRARDQLALR